MQMKLICLFEMSEVKTLWIMKDEEVCYKDVSSGSEGITLLSLINDGKSAKIETLLIIFQNRSRRYPVRDFTDDFIEAVYRTGPKG